MSEAFDLACACGAFTGTIEVEHSGEGDRLSCYCKDCQTFATRFGKSERILDPHGGTDLYQTRCARLHVETGRERLASIHLTRKPTLRWYASCCDTPLFNTFASGKLPYLTVLLANAPEADVERLVGPPRGGLSLESAQGDTSAIPAAPLPRQIVRQMRRMARDVLSGDRRRSPLFDTQSLAPIAKPVRVGESEA